MSKENQMNTQTGSELEELLCSDCGEKVSPADIKCSKCGAEFENDISDLDEEVTRGRKLAISIIAVSVAMLIVTGIINLLNFDMDLWIGKDNYKDNKVEINSNE